MGNRGLQRLARLHGVLPAYVDGFRQSRCPSDEALLAVLAELDPEIQGRESIGEAILRARAEKWSRVVEPVTACWAGRPPECLLRVPAEHAGARIESALSVEGGRTRSWKADARALDVRREASVDGRSYAVLRLPLPATLPAGYHRLALQLGGCTWESLVIRAPSRCVDLPHAWGVFAPLYALRSEASPASGTFTELGQILDWVRGLGGSLVGTLPLLSAFLDEPFAPSPYTPVSRCFWNEFYVDLRAIPEWTPEFGGVGDATDRRHVDYRGQMRAKRAALERAAVRLKGKRLDRFAGYVASRPELRAYAAFRSGLEAGGVPGTRYRRDDPGCRYHAYAQWIADAQIAKAAQSGAGGLQGLYLDLPLGTHPLGFDRFRYPEIFARRAAGGAPPDRFFSEGQNWGFAPVNPKAARASGHGYFIACIRHHLRHARALRVDHVMGLHRTYWIPQGFDGGQGAYVQAPAEELYAILCLESERHGTAVIGEDLGTVPAYVRGCMQRHGVRRTYVGQFEIRAERDPPVSPPPRESVATMNTHDTAMFATFWDGGDIDDQVDLGLLDEPHAVEARSRRQLQRAAVIADFAREGGVETEDASTYAVMVAWLARLALSDAECVIVTLEDLWGETRPQNTPGTDRERPNWTRRASKSMEEIRSDRDVSRMLRLLSRFRRSAETNLLCRHLIRKCF